MYPNVPGASAPKSSPELLQTPFVHNGEKGIIAIGERAIGFVLEDQREKFIVPEHSMLLVRSLLRRPDVPQLKTTLSLERQSTEIDASDAYKKLAETIYDFPIRSHFIKFGHGKSTWYGFLTNNEDPSLLLKNGRAIVRGELNERRRRRRMKAFDALESYYSEDKDHFFTKKRVVGTAAGGIIIVAVGGSVAYFTRNISNGNK